ncbi:bone morphogenetic protein 3 [Sarotherodon galilaeus]
MKVPQDVDISQTERELTSPPSPKRSRPECRVMNDHSGLSRFDFPELLTFRKTNHSPSSASTLQKTEGLISTLECLEDEKSQERPQDTKSDVIPNTEVTSYNKSTHVDSSKVSFIPTESYLLLGKEEQLPVTETDKLSFYQSDDTDSSLGESATIASTNTSSHSDGRLPGTSLKDQTPGGCSPSTGNEKYRRQVQKNVNEMQTRNEEVRCQPNCTNKESVRDGGFCSTRSQFAEVVETTQKRTEPEFNEYIFFTKEESGSKRSSSDYADSKPLCSDPVEEPSGNLAEVGKKEKNDSGLQFCEKENVSVCDGKTEGQVNKKALILFAAECSERSILSHDVMLERNPANESTNLDVDDLCGEKRADGACKIIAKAQSETADHTTVTTLPDRISQELAEGDNDEGPFHVIDPAICSETDREAEENCCNSASAAGPKLSPSVEVDTMEMPLPLHSHMRPSEKVSCPDRTECFNNESRTWHQEGANDDFCQAGPQSSSITTNETHTTFIECDCQWKSRFSRSPTKPLPPGDHPIQGSHGSMGHEFKEQSRSSCFSVRLDHLETSEVEHSQRGIDSLDMTAVIKESKEIFCFVKELEINEYMNPKRTVELEEKPLLQNEQHKDNTTEVLTCDCKAEWNEGEAHEWDNELKLTETEQRSKLKRLSDQPFSADISMTEVGEEERKEVTEVGDEMKTDGPENSETLVQSEDYVQRQNDHKADMTQLSSGEGADEWTEWSKLPLGSEDGQEHKLSCVSDCQDKAENKADFLAFSFSSTTDAVVPCQGNLSHSQKAHSNPTSINCSDRFSPLPSAFCNLVPEGFDTFEKIQLSPDDDDATGVGNIPVLVSSPGQLLKTPERLLYHFMSVAESNMHERIPEEEEECITENMANRLLSSDSACNELPNFILGADAIDLEWPEREPNCESVCDSSEHIQDELNPELMSSTVSAESDSPASGVNSCAEFEMKNQFDSVLKELNLFFEISRNDFENDCKPNFISPEQCTDRTKVLEGSASERTERLTSPDVGCHRGAASDDVAEDHSLDMCEGDPVVSRTAVSSDGEQEVPLSRHLCREAPVAEKHRGAPEQPRRLEPLKTCARPIRVGLSKRAKTKHLHRPRPYK